MWGHAQLSLYANPYIRPWDRIWAIGVGYIRRYRSLPRKKADPWAKGTELWIAHVAPRISYPHYLTAEPYSSAAIGIPAFWFNVLRVIEG